MASRLGRVAQVWASMARVLGSHSRLQRSEGMEAILSNMQPSQQMTSQDLQWLDTAQRFQNMAV